MAKELDGSHAEIHRDQPGFVSREAELKALRDRVKAGDRVIGICGLRGSGKTALVWRFVDQHPEMFPAGRMRLDAMSLMVQHELSGQSIFPQLERISQFPTLLEIDTADFLDQRKLTRLLEVVRLPLFGHVTTALVAVSQFNHPLIDFWLTLKPLQWNDLKELLSARLSSGVARETIKRLSRLTQAGTGTPRLALEAAMLISRGVTDAELISMIGTWTDFQAPGIVCPDGNPLSPLSPAAKQIIREVREVNTDLLRLLEKYPEMLRELPSRRFEEVVAELLTRFGYDVELTPAIKDGGFDMYAAKKESLGSFLFLVECKRYSPLNRVGVELVRSLHGVVQDKRATGGVLVTTSFFTKGAKDFQDRNRYEMSLTDYSLLRQWLQRATGGSTGNTH